jgi:sugar porter (SP) family MFS transporter
MSLIEATTTRSDSAVVSAQKAHGCPDTSDLWYLWRISLIAAMGGFLFGYDIVVIGGAKPFFEAYFALTSETSRGWANSCALLGCLLGSLLSGAFSDRWGRKRLLLLAACLFAVSSALTGWSANFGNFVLWRIVGGIAIGLASNISPMYIAEVTPATLRGRMVSVNQLTIVLGVLAAQLVNWVIADRVVEYATPAMIRDSWNGQYGWRWMFIAVTVPSLVFLIGILTVPESPRWLAQVRRHDLARSILSRIGGPDYAAAEFKEIERSIDLESREQVRWRELLTPGLRRVLLIGVTLAILQPWCGINVILTYAEEVFRQAGYGVGSVLFNILITGLVLTVFTFVAIFTVDRVGRRALMLVGCAGIGLFHLLLGTSYHAGLTGMIVVAPVLGAIACYAFSLAPITWVLISEIFPNRIRGPAVAVAVSAMWIANFALIYTFPFLQAALGSAGTFWLYAGICGAGFLFILRRVPETKGKSLEQIERELAQSGARVDAT